MQMTVPCGQCIGCRLERSRQWAIRCMHEASLYEHNSFITLTFNDEHLDPIGSLRKSDFQNFMKRLRKAISPERVRFYHCGEYGSKGGRPHHHACLFGYDFKDKELWRIRNNVPLYTSKFLDSIWSLDGKQLGFCTVGDVTFESAAYVARYIMKKQLGDPEYYGDLVPPYTTMSRRPGVGSKWFDKFGSDVYPDDFVVIRGQLRVKPPKYYDSIFDCENPTEMRKVKRSRQVEARAKRVSLERLAQKEQHKLLKLKELGRKYEESSVQPL